MAWLMASCGHGRGESFGKGLKMTENRTFKAGVCRWTNFDELPCVPCVPCVETIKQIKMAMSLNHAHALLFNPVEARVQCSQMETNEFD